MVRLHFGGKHGVTQDLQPTEEMLVVRTRRREPVARATLSAAGRAAVATMQPRARFEAAGVEILQARDDGGRERAILKQENALEFAGRALVARPGGEPIAYTENIFLKLEDELPTDAIEELLRPYEGLVVSRQLDFARNGFFLHGPEGIGLEIFGLAEALLDEAGVELCHPEIVRERVYRAAFPNQWHLHRCTIGDRDIDQHAGVATAWEATTGEGITIAVIDDGVDIDHPEFAGAGKLIAPFDATRRTGDPRPRGPRDNHGTACAGVAAASGDHGASGVAPGARLMPIRLASGLGSMDEAEAFHWAATNGADIISCSWGPADGRWWDPTDPRHDEEFPLPDNTRLALDAAADQGRDGRGCVILFAAGNGNESVDNDGYARYEKIIAVAACNDEGRRSAYSDFGRAVWCAFPSNHGEPSLTPGIWTTDRQGGLGYNPGRDDRGDADGFYTNDFGGTSSACPGAAGVAALVLAVNPALTRGEVRDILKASCDRIDEENGAYDELGHSHAYGWGRLNAARAVELAQG